MASTWGSTALKILIGTLRPGAIPANVIEVPLLPDSTDIDAIASVLQQTGTLRKRVKGKLYVSAIASYTAYVTDYRAGTTRTLTIDDTGIAATYMIESLGEPEFIQSDAIFFDICWVEV